MLSLSLLALSIGGIQGSMAGIGPLGPLVSKRQGKQALLKSRTSYSVCALLHISQAVSKRQALLSPSLLALRIGGIQGHSTGSRRDKASKASKDLCSLHIVIRPPSSSSSQVSYKRSFI